MKFKLGKLWGVPRFSTLAGQWLIDYFDETGSRESVGIPTDAEREWIIAHPAEVERMQMKLEAWFTRSRE